MSKSTNPNLTLTPTHIVALAMQQYWTDEIESYKASHRDGLLAALDALTQAGFEPVIDLDVADPTDAALLDAADATGYAMGQAGFDWVTDRCYHVAMAALLMGSSDV